jgi:hypothetical protein
LGQSNDAGASLASRTSSNGFAALVMTSNGTPQGNLLFAISTAVRAAARGDWGAGEYNTATLVKYA